MISFDDQQFGDGTRKTLRTSDDGYVPENFLLCNTESELSTGILLRVRSRL